MPTLHKLNISALFNQRLKLPDTQRPHRCLDLIPQPVQKTSTQITFINLDPEESEMLRQRFQLGSILSNRHRTLFQSQKLSLLFLLSTHWKIFLQEDSPKGSPIHSFLIRLKNQTSPSPPVFSITQQKINNIIQLGCIWCMQNCEDLLH